MREKDKDDKEMKDDTQLEENVAKLLEQAHEPPRMRPEARARILADLKAGLRPDVPQRTGKVLPFALTRKRIAVGALAVAASVVLAWAMGNPPIDKAPAVYRNELASPRRV